MSPSSSDDAKRAADLEKEIESIRDNLDHLVAELDHRRHCLSPVRLTREHPVWVSLAGGLLLAGLTATGVLAYKKRERRRQSWLERGRRLTSAIRQITADQPVETSPGMAWKVLTAAGTATAAVVGRRLAKRLFWPSKKD